MTIEITPEMIDRGAEAFRLAEQSGRNLTPWANVGLRVKRKWRVRAEKVLRAALDGEATVVEISHEGIVR